MSAIRMSPFQKPPAIAAYPRKNLVELSCQIDEVVLNLWLKSDNIRPLLQTELLVLCMILRIAFHKEFSCLPRAIAFHGISPPFFVQAGLQQYCCCSFFYSSYSSFSNTVSLRSQHFLLNSCSAILRVLSLQYVLTCPESAVASTTCLHVCHLATHPCAGLSDSTDCQHTNSRTANPRHFRLDTSHIVSSLLLSESTKGIRRCGQACRQKHHASTSCSIWLHPLNGFVPNQFLQMAPLLQCGPCVG